MIYNYQYLSILFNKSIDVGSCPIKFKYNFITPIFKKVDPSRKENNIKCYLNLNDYNIDQQFKYIIILLVHIS